MVHSLTRIGETRFPNNPENAARQRRSTPYQAKRAPSRHRPMGTKSQNNRTKLKRMKQRKWSSRRNTVGNVRASPHCRHCSELRSPASTLLEQISSTRAKRDVNGIRHSNSPYLRQELPFDLGDPEELFPVTPDGQVLPVADSSFSNGGDGFLPPASDDFGAPAALDFLPDTG